MLLVHVSFRVGCHQAHDNTDDHGRHASYERVVHIRDAVQELDRAYTRRILAPVPKQRSIFVRVIGRVEIRHAGWLGDPRGERVVSTILGRQR